MNETLTEYTRKSKAATDALEARERRANAAYRRAYLYARRNNVRDETAYAYRAYDAALINPST